MLDIALVIEVSCAAELLKESPECFEQQLAVIEEIQITIALQQCPNGTTLCLSASLCLTHTNPRARHCASNSAMNGCRVIMLVCRVQLCR